MRRAHGAVAGVAEQVPATAQYAVPAGGEAGEGAIRRLLAT